MGHAGCGGEMHQAGIVADIDGAALQAGGDFRDVELAAEVDELGGSRSIELPLAVDPAGAQQVGQEVDHSRAADAERRLVEVELPVLPLFFMTNTNMYRDSVHGVHENVRNLHPLKFVYKVPP